MIYADQMPPEVVGETDEFIILPLPQEVSDE